MSIKAMTWFRFPVYLSILSSICPLSSTL